MKLQYWVKLKWVIPEKSKQGEPTFLKKPGLFRFVRLPLEILDKTKHYSWKFGKICYTTWKFQDQKQRTLKDLHSFFLITPGDSTSFLIDPWIFCMLFLQYALTSPSSPPI